MDTEKSITRSAPSALATPGDAKLDAAVAESLVVKGDVSGLSPVQRAALYVSACRELGLNPRAQPFAFLRLNGKEVMYATRGATDQLARIHNVTREIVDGPKVIDLAGTKLVICVARASLPGGRSETSTATLPLADPAMVLMKAETKAKRRATLALLGLAILDEDEVRDVPDRAKGDARQVTAAEIDGATPAPALPSLRSLGIEPPARHTPVTEAPADDPERAAIKAEGQHDERPAIDLAFARDVAAIELPGEAVAVWIKHRADLTNAPSVEREAAWKALCARVEEVGKMKSAKVWLKKAIAEEDARRQAAASSEAAS